MCARRNPFIHKLSAPDRGVYSAFLLLLPQLSLNFNLVGSFTLKRPDRRRAEAALWRAAKAEGRAPTNRQLRDAPRRNQCVPKLSAPDRGVYAASVSLVSRHSLIRRYPVVFCRLFGQQSARRIQRKQTKEAKSSPRAGVKTLEFSDTSAARRCCGRGPPALRWR